MEQKKLTPPKTARAAPLPKSARSDAGPVEILFPQGLVGCPDWRRFQLSPNPFEWCGELSCLDGPEVSLIVADPLRLRVDLSFELDDADTDALQLTSAEEARVLVILTVNRDPATIFANLAGPIVINWRTRQARQVVLDHHAFPLRAPVLSGAAATSIVNALSGGEAAGHAPPRAPHHIPATAPGKGA